MSAIEVCRKFMNAIESKDFIAAFKLLAVDGQYIVIGTTKVSRIYRGPQDLLQNLVPVLSAFVEPPTLKFDEPIIDKDRAVMLAAGNGVGPTGPYNQPYYAFVARVRGDEFSEIIEFMDTGMLESALFGKG